MPPLTDFELQTAIAVKTASEKKPHRAHVPEAVFLRCCDEMKLADGLPPAGYFLFHENPPFKEEDHETASIYRGSPA